MLINYPEMICFVAHDSMVDEHRFHCYKIAVSFKGTYSCTLDGDTLYNVSGHIINSNVRHVCHAPGTSVLVYFVEIKSPLGLAIRARLGDRKYENISALLATHPVAQLLNQGPRMLLEHRMPDFASSVMLTLFPSLSSAPKPMIDSRLERIVHYVDAHIEQTITLAQIARLINLSTDRTRHLFEAEMGTPFTQYVRWKRINLVIYSVLTQQMDLGQAAHQFGFFDQAHFNRVFKRMFGTNPGFFLKQMPCLLMLSPQLATYRA